MRQVGGCDLLALDTWRCKQGLTLQHVERNRRRDELRQADPKALQKALVQLRHTHRPLGTSAPAKVRYELARPSSNKQHGRRPTPPSGAMRGCTPGRRHPERAAAAASLELHQQPRARNASPETRRLTGWRGGLLLPPGTLLLQEAFHEVSVNIDCPQRVYRVPYHGMDAPRKFPL